MESKKTLGKSVINQNEAYTSKTCYSCGKINDIGSNKIYNCIFVTINVIEIFSQV